MRAQVLLVKSHSNFHCLLLFSAVCIQARNKGCLSWNNPGGPKGGGGPCVQPGWKIVLCEKGIPE